MPRAHGQRDSGAEHRPVGSVGTCVQVEFDVEQRHAHRLRVVALGRRRPLAVTQPRLQRHGTIPSGRHDRPAAPCPAGPHCRDQCGRAEQRNPVRTRTVHPAPADQTAAEPQVHDRPLRQPQPQPSVAAALCAAVAWQPQAQAAPGQFTHSQVALTWFMEDSPGGLDEPVGPRSEFCTRPSLPT